LQGPSLTAMRRFSRCARPLLPSEGQVREAGKGRPESLHRSRGLPGASGFTREGFQGQAGRAESCGEIAYAARFSLRCVMSKSSGCVSPVVGQFENERIPLLAEEGYPLLAEEGWPRHQTDIAKPPYWSGRGGQTGAIL